MYDIDKYKSDIDFHLYLKETAFEKQGILPLELYLKIHRDLSKIDIKPFRYIQCDALTDKLPRDLLVQFLALIKLWLEGYQ